MTTTEIRPDTTMGAIEEAFPSARRALFQRYHVGGCSECAYQPTETLAEMCKDHNILDVNEVIAHVLRSDEVDRTMQVDPEEVHAWLDEGRTFHFLDLRTPEERGAAVLERAEALDFADSQRWLALPKETPFVFCCTNGDRALDVAAYFAGHGFTEARALRGGVDAWRERVDPSIPVS